MICLNFHRFEQENPRAFIRIFQRSDTRFIFLSIHFQYLIQPRNSTIELERPLKLKGFLGL